MRIEAYIKPTNYEISQTRKYKSNKFRADNMLYDEEADNITCPAGNQLTNVGIKHSKSKSGFISEQSVYRCKACCECPMKAQCTKSKTGRTIQFSKAFRKYRAQSQARITTDLGTALFPAAPKSTQAPSPFGLDFLCHTRSCVCCVLFFFSEFDLWPSLHRLLIHGFTGTMPLLSLG